MLQQACFNTAAGATENRHRAVTYTLLISYNAAIKSSCSSKFCFTQVLLRKSRSQADCLSIAYQRRFSHISQSFFDLQYITTFGRAYFLPKTKGATEATPLKLPDSMNTYQISAVYASASKSSLTSDGSDISTLTIHPFPYGS